MVLVHEESSARGASLHRRYPSRTNNSRDVAEELLAIDADRMRERGWEIASSTWIEKRWVRFIDFVFSILATPRIFPHGGSWGHLEVVFRRSTPDRQATAPQAVHPEA